MASICLGLRLTAMRFQLSGRLAATDMSVISSVVRLVEAPDGGDELEVGALEVAHDTAQAHQLLGLAWRDGTGSPLASLWLMAHDDGEAEAAGFEALAQQALHLGQVGRRRPPHRRPARPSPAGAAREWPTMNPALTASVPSRRSSHSPKLCHVPHGTPCCSDVSGMPSTRASMRIRYSPCSDRDRGDGEAAVAADHRGDAVQRRRREVAVPEHLRVVVRVHVDETRRDELAGRIDRPRRGIGDLTGDELDATVLDARHRPGSRLGRCRPPRCHR